MKNVVFSACFALVALFAQSAAFADGAIICKSAESTGACKGRPYCCYAGNESDGDKYCKNLGCVRGGTSSSCPTAANVGSCGTRDQKLTSHALQSLPTDERSLMSVQP